MSCRSTPLPFLFLLFVRVQSIDLTHEFEPPEVDGSAVDICRIFFVTTPAPFTTTTTTTPATTTTTTTTTPTTTKTTTTPTTATTTATPTTTTTKKTTTTTPTTTTTKKTTTTTTTTTKKTTTPTTTTTKKTTTPTTTTTTTTTTTKKTTTTTPTTTTTTTKKTTTTTPTTKKVVTTTKKPAVQSSPRKPEIKNTRTPIRPKPAPAQPVTVSRPNPAASLLHYLLNINRGYAAHSLPWFNNIYYQPMGWLPHRSYAMTSDSDESAATPLKRAAWTDKYRWKIGSFSSEDSSDES